MAGGVTPAPARQYPPNIVTALNGPYPAYVVTAPFQFDEWCLPCAEEAKLVPGTPGPDGGRCPAHHGWPGVSAGAGPPSPTSSS